MTAKMAAGLLIASTIFLGLALNAAIVMGVAGVLNNYWPSVPAFSFWESALISLGMGAVFSGIRGTVKAVFK